MLPTASAWLDSKTDGIHPGEIWIVAGRPGSGKTAWGLQTARTSADNPARKVCFFSMEMEGWQLALRMFASVKGYDCSKLVSGKQRITQEDSAWFSKYITSINFDVVEFGFTFEEILTTLGRLFGKDSQPDLVVIDYVQLVDWSMEGSERIAIVKYMQQIKQMAKRTGMAFLIISQLKRPDRAEEYYRPPVLSDLKGSGSLEQDADRVVFLYKSIDDTGKVQHYLDIAKNRIGDTGKKTINYEGKCYRFSDVEEDPDIAVINDIFGGEVTEVE